ncbi:unnamed protein product [Cylindrotheca closterium]|uniref:Mitochondrial carrier protein n=1 Tax=Cylindrotheca closterium TaxID=2856 RepID=A0AAD2FVY3_9STRA|nr:unnamed protein product [Cylindrotheca closterium]
MMGGIPVPFIQYLILTVIVAYILCVQNCQALSNVNSRRLCDINHPNPIDDKDSNLNFHDPIVSRGSFFAITAASTATAVVSTPLIAKALTSEAVGTVSESTIGDEVISFSSTATNIAAAASKGLSTRQSIAEFVAGAALGAVKTTVKYPLDSATVRLQMPNSEYSVKELGKLFSGSYDGITLSLLSNIPAGAIFFAAKDAVKTSLKSSTSFESSPKWVTTSIGVLVALLPYWVVRNPSEVIKVRQQAGIEGYGGEVNALEAIQRTLQNSTSPDGNGISELYTGYFENYAYSCPADIIKFVGYEAITQGRKNLSPIEGAGAGALATACAQLVTTPLDVVRNRLMAGKNKTNKTSSSDIDQDTGNYLDALTTLAREEGISGLFAGAAPRVGKAILSGAIQFATYEETKQTISKMLQR